MTALTVHNAEIRTATARRLTSPLRRPTSPAPTHWRRPCGHLNTTGVESLCISRMTASRRVALALNNVVPPSVMAAANASAAQKACGTTPDVTISTWLKATAARATRGGPIPSRYCFLASA
jgi:hypothetical protein